MGAHGRIRTALSVWVAPLGRVFCPRGHIQTVGDCLGRPAEDTLTVGGIRFWMLYGDGCYYDLGI
jgi:hypothetical protein